MKAPLGSHAGRGQEHQAADGGKQQLGYERTHAAVVQEATARLSSRQWNLEVDECPSDSSDLL